MDAIPSSTSPGMQRRQSHQNPHHVKRKALNCLPCRQHKLRCDRHVPCSNCRRSSREDLCRKHPASAPGRDIELPGAHARAQAGTLQVELTTSSNRHLPSPISSQQENHNETNMPALAVGAAGHQSRGQSQDQSQSQTAYNSSCIQQQPPPRSQLSPSLNEGTRRVSNIHMLQVYDTLAQRKAQPRTDQRAEAIASTDASLLAPIDTAQMTAMSGALMLQWSLSSNDQELFWKRQLCGMLPTQSQCDVLSCYYFENINWIFQSIHVPSFRKQSTRFWSTNMDEVDLTWLSLLYTIISVSGLYFPLEATKIIGMESSKIRSLAHVWHSASRQALHAGNFETKPSLTQLQTFSVTQLYWLAMNKVEALNS